MVVWVAVGTADAYVPTTLAISGNNNGAYTTETMQSANDTNDSYSQLSYIIQGGTVDTSLTIPSSGNARNAQRWVVHVFRGVDASTPLDVTTVHATGLNTGRPDPGAITPTTSGAWIAAFYASAAATGTAFTAPTELVDWLGGTQADTYDCMAGGGYYDSWASGAYNPQAITAGGTTGTGDSWTATTIALRPIIDPAFSQDAFRLYADGTESGSTALANQDTNYTADVSGGDFNLGLRVRIQEDNGGAGASTDDYQLQYSKNSGAIYNVNTTGSSMLVDSYPISNSGGAGNPLGPSTTRIGQSFTANGTKITSAKIDIRRNGSPTGNAVMKLYAHSGTYGTSSVPTGTALATSDVVDVSTISATEGFQTFTFSGANQYQTTNGTYYCLAIEYTGGDGSNNITVYIDNTSPTHSGNTFSGSSADASSDRIFEVYGVYADGAEVIGFGSASLTDGGATTNRLGAGTGSFVAGEVSEDGLVDDLQITASNYTELLYSITLVSSALANNDTLDFRVVRNGAVLNTYTVTPRITASKTTTPQYTKTHTTDTLKRLQTTKVHTTSSYLRAKQTLTVTHTTNSLKRLQTTKAHTTDALKKLRATKTHTTDSLKRGQYTKVHTADALKRLQTTRTHTTDSYLRVGAVTYTRTHTTDSLRRSQNTRSHTTDSFKRLQVTKTHTTDALKRLQTTKTHTTDAVKRLNTTRTHTTNALKRLQTTVSHTTSSVKRLQVVKTHTTNSVLRLQTTKSHTTNSLLRKANAVSHTTSSYTRGSNSVQHTTDSLKRAINTISHTTDAAYHRSKSHTTDSFLDSKRRYWVGGTGTWDNTNTTNWSTEPGGAGGASVPTSSTDVYIDAFSGTGTITLSATAAAKNVDFTGYTGTLSHPASTVWTISGSLTMASGMTYTKGSTSSSSITFNSTTTGNTVTSAGKVFGSVTYNGSGGEWTLQDTYTSNSLTFTTGTLNTNGQTLAITSFSSSGTGVRTLNLGSSSINVSNSGSSFSINATNLTFNPGTSSITCHGNFSGAGLTYYDVTIDSGTNQQLIGGTNTFNNLTFYGLGSVAQGDISLQENQVVNGTFTATGGMYVHLIVSSTSVGTQRTITANTVSLAYTGFVDIVGAGSGSWTSSTIGDGGGNSGITFPAAKNVYWRGNSGSWSSSTNWAATSGGTGGVAPPLLHDTAIFDANSFSSAGQTVTFSLTGGKYLSAINDTGVTNSPTFNFDSGSKFVFGDYIVNSTVTNNTGTVNLRGFGTNYIKSTSDFYTLWIHARTGTYTLQSNITSTSTTLGISLFSGTLDADTYNVNTKIFGSSQSTSYNRIINMGSGTWTISGTGTAWNFSGTQTLLTVNGETSTLIISDTTATAKTVSGGSKTYNNIRFTGDNITLSGVNTFNNFEVNNAGLTNGLKVTAGDTQIINGTFSTNGSAGNEARILSTSGTTKFNLSKSSGSVTADYIYVNDSNVTGGAKWYRGTGFIDGLDNTGWASVYTKTHTTDAYLAVAPVTYTKTHTSDALKRKQNTVSHTSDALKRKQNTVSHTTNSLKRLQTTKTHTTDSLKKMRTTKTHITDALKRAQITKTHTTDSLKRLTVTVSHTTSSLKRLQVTKTHTTSSVLRLQTTKNHTTSSVLRKTYTISHTADAYKRDNNIVFFRNHTTNAVKRAQNTVSHTTDAQKRIRSTVSHSSDSLLRKAYTVSHSTSANKKKTTDVSHTTNSLKRAQNTVQHTTSSLKRKQTIVTHTTNSLLRVRTTASHTTNSNRFFGRQHSTSAVKQRKEPLSRIMYDEEGNIYYRIGSRIVKKIN